MVARASGIPSRQTWFAYLDEANGWLSAPSTRYHRNWTVVRNRCNDAIDRFGTRHAATMKELYEVTSLVRRTRVLEGKALDNPTFTPLCQGRVKDGRGCKLVAGHGGYHRAVVAGR